MDDNNFQNYNENRNSVDRSRPMGLLFILIIDSYANEMSFYVLQLV